MIRILLRVGLFIICATPASADFFNRQAKSGLTKRMKVYTSWNKDCSSKEGIVRVISKPKNGTLTPSKTQTKIRNSRFRPGYEQPCKGQPTIGFNVDYRSNAGFRGQDQFVLDVTFGTKRQVIDTFIVDVR